jgi:hypothetical protein
MKKTRLVIFGMIVICALGIFFNWRRGLKQNDTYFLPVSSVTLSSSKIPCVNLLIDGIEFTAELDLGLSGDISMTRSFLDKVQNKTLVGTATMRGWNGKWREENVYQIPEVQLGGGSFTEVYLQESSKEFEMDTILLDSQKREIENVRIGCHIFRQKNLYLDLGNLSVILCDSMDTLKKNGIEVDQFIDMRLILDDGGMAMQVSSGEEDHRWEFDTGATFNIFHKDRVGNESMSEMVLDEKNVVDHSIMIGGVDFGKIHFRTLPIELSLKTQAVLGMDFFLSHKVFFDFKRRYMYIAKR